MGEHLGNSTVRSLSALSEQDQQQVRGWLEDLGVSVEGLDLATDDVSSALVRPGERLSLVEARERSGLAPEDFEELRLASGYPGEGQGIDYTDQDLANFATFGAALELFSREELLNFVRVMSTSLSRVTDAAVSLFSTDVESPTVESGGSELDVIKKQIEALSLLEQVMPVMDRLMRLHMELSSKRRSVARADGASKLRMGIGFLDLVGFTPQSFDMDEAELTALLRDFERTAHNAVVAGGGRLVKLIGDEVMFVAVEADALCQIASTLVSEYNRHSDVTPRGGLAYGDLLSLSGDYFGPTVNLASRIGDLAVPNEVLVTPELAEAAPAYSFEPAGRRMLKGFPESMSLLSLVL